MYAHNRCNDRSYPTRISPYLSPHKLSKFYWIGSFELARSCCFACCELPKCTVQDSHTHVVHCPHLIQEPQAATAFLNTSRSITIRTLRVETILAIGTLLSWRASRGTSFDK